jgi:hypothetical protein
MKNNAVILYLAVLVFLPFLTWGQTQTVTALSSPKGVYLRLTPTALSSKTVGKSKYIIKRRKLNEANPQTIGQMQLVKTYKDLQNTVGSQEIQEFEKMKKFTTATQTMAYLNSSPSYKDLSLFAELKVEFLQALGFAFLDNSAQKNELYRYYLYEITDKKTETLIEEVGVFYNPKNFLLDDISTQLRKVSGSDSSVFFEWNVVFPSIKNNSVEQTKASNQLSDAFRQMSIQATKILDNSAYDKIKAVYIENQKVISVNPIDDFTTRFNVFYRVNGNESWNFLEKKLATSDTSGKKIIIARIAGKLDDLVETILIPEDYVYNTGDTSTIARGVVAHKGSVELIYGVSASDSTNSIILKWKKLSDKPYYSGIEIAKSWGNEQPQVIEILSASQDTFTDTDVYPAGRMFTYFVRPLFIDFQDLEQDVPASAVMTCGKFSKPTPPFNLKVKSEGAFAKLTWEVADEQAGHSYFIYRGTSPQKMIPIRSAVKTQEYLDTTSYLSARLTYYYAIMATNVTQDTSDFSPYVSYTPIKKEEVQSPPLLGHEIINNEAILSWSDVKMNDDFIVGYVLQRKKQGDLKFTTIHQKLLTQANFTDETFERGIDYLYKVASVTIKGDTADFSSEVSIKADIIKTEVVSITNIKLTNMSKTIKVSWPSVEFEGIKNYKIYRKLPTEENFKLIATLPNGNFDFEDKNVTTDTIYVYTVTALYKDNNESVIAEKKSIYREIPK